MNITSVIESHSPETARASLYYTARYIKQAASFREYEKDIFEDEARNLPSDKVRKVALKIVAFIEKREGMGATEFSDSMIIRLLEEITDLEASQSSEMSEFEREHAATLAAGMQPPN